MLSRTDFKSTWSRPNKAGEHSKKSIDDIWSTREKPDKGLKAAIDEGALLKMKELVNKKNQFGLHWLLGSEPDVSLMIFVIM
jgi:hypothetical protein